MADHPADRAPEGADALLASLDDLRGRIESARANPPTPGRGRVWALAGVLAVVAGLVVTALAVTGVSDDGDVAAERTAATTEAPDSTEAPEPTAAPDPTATTATTAVPPTTVEPEGGAGSAPPSATDGGTEVTVAPGDSFWTLAEDAAAASLGRDPTVQEVTTLWADMLAANADRLVEPGNFDLIFPGQTLLLPAGAAP